MWSQRQRAVVWALAAVAATWIAAAGGYWFVQHAKVTPDKVRAYVGSMDFSRLSAADRSKAIHKLADMLTSLSLEERQRLRLDRTAYRWFEQMTEEERGEFLEATMPTGFKQMLGSFEEMPPERRQRFVADAVRRLKTAREQLAKNGELPQGSTANTNNVVLSPELQQKVAAIGLKTYYGESSAQTKAELAPLLEELQRSMESGAMLHGGPRR